MLRYLIILLMTIHGLAHAVGFAQAFQYAELQNFTVPISTALGILWMSSALFFVTSAIILLLKKNYWWMIAIPATIFSQFVIFASWTDAKLGTVANMLIVAAIIFGWADSTLKVGQHTTRE